MAPGYNRIIRFWKKKWNFDNEVSFSNAFLVLGMLPFSEDSRLKLKSSKSVKFSQAEMNEELESVIEELIVLAKNGSSLLWQFPEPDSFYYHSNGNISVLKLNPEILAGLCQKLSGKNLVFRLENNPDLEMLEFFQHLLNSAGIQASEYIYSEFKDAKIHMKWPLRLGYLPDNQVEIITDTITNEYSLQKVTKSIKIGRDEANCDVLIFKGNINQLFAEINALNVPVKCNLCIIKGNFSEKSTKISYLELNKLSASICAGGFIMVDSTIRDEEFAGGIKNLIFNLCHNEKLEIAVSTIFYFKKDKPPLIFLNKSIASFQIQEQLMNMINRVNSIPGNAKIKFDINPVHKLGFDKGIVKMKIPENISEFKKAIRENYQTMSPEFDHEGGAATTISEINKTLQKAGSSGDEPPQNQERFLQASFFVEKEKQYQVENRAFVKDTNARIRVGIGFPDDKKKSFETPVPVDTLPKNEEIWHLTVVLSEPVHIKKPIKKDIYLPQKNIPGTTCDFDFIPTSDCKFEGRLVLLHRGRILQTGVLKADIALSFETISDQSEITLDEIIPVRKNTSNLEKRRQFDLAFITNHNSTGIPRLTAVSKNHAWLSDLSSCIGIATEISSDLTEVAFDVVGHTGGLDAPNNTQILVKLAQKGAALRRKITTDLEAPKNKAEIAKLQMLQIITTKNDKVIPFEFIYDFFAPNDSAKLCDSWKKALTDIIDSGDINKVSCYKNCKINKSNFVCPLGFWGIQKVIERHQYSPHLAKNGKYIYLQSVESVENRDTLSVMGNALVAASIKVDNVDIEPVIAACLEKFGAPPRLVKDWDEWVKVVKEIKPKVILAMPHAGGSGTGITLEISGKTMKSNLMEDGYVRPNGADYSPLVALLGCDTTGTAEDYGGHVSSFTEYKAAIVIGTIASVFGKHAANVTKKLVEGLNAGAGKNERVGEVIRYIKQKSLLEGMVMPLCMVAFGDADWKLQ